MATANGEMGRKAVILAVIGAAAIMFVASFIYRMNHPNLFVKVQQQAAQQEDHDHDGDGEQDHGATPPGMSENSAMGKVKEFMGRVEQNPDDVEALVGLGNSFLMMRAWDRALEPLQRAHELDPENVGVLKAMGIAHFNKEDFVKATEAYDAILIIDPDDSLALFNLGVIFKYYFEKPDAARTYFEKVLAVEKDDAEVIAMAKQELAK